MNGSIFGSASTNQANVCEYAQSYFPASQVTPEFQKRIEDDFARFDKVLQRKKGIGPGLATGWIAEEQEHEISREKKPSAFLL